MPTPSLLLTATEQHHIEGTSTAVCNFAFLVCHATHVPVKIYLYTAGDACIEATALLQEAAYYAWLTYDHRGVERN